MYERWMDNASCADFPREMFFPTDGGGVVKAQKICARCPVAKDCLRYALVNHIDYGVWGGCSERKRRRLLHGIGLADVGLADVVPIAAGLRLVPDRDFGDDDYDADGFDADVEVGASEVGSSEVGSERVDAAHRNLADTDVLIG